MARAATKVNSPTPYNVIGAAHEIGCTPGTLYEYIRAERIKPQYTPRVTRFSTTSTSSRRARFSSAAEFVAADLP